MSTRNMPYRVFAISIVISILTSLIPYPAWASILHPVMQEDGRSLVGGFNGSADENFASILPPGIQEQLQSVGMLGPDGSPEGMLLDQSALSGVSSANLPSFLANPISISRVQSAYVPNALNSGLLEIEFAVTNNQNPALVPQVPDNATITETIDILSSFDFSADPSTIRNVIITDKLVGSTFASSTPVAETVGDDLSINLGDIAPLATVTATILITVPSTGGAFINLDVGARAFGSLRGNQISNQAIPISLAPDSFAEYFIDTPDADINDEYMLNALSQTSGEAIDLFEYVQSFGYEAYLGSLRGTRGTIWSEAGNSVDQASTLIAMLRASGIPARYAHGTIMTQEAQVLIDSMFEAPVSVIGNIPANTEVSSPTTDPELISEVIDHWWTQAYINGSWIDLDPSFSSSTIGQTFTTSVGEMAELPDNLRHKVTMAAVVEQYNAFPQIVGYDGQSTVRPLEATFNSVELVGKPVTFNQLVNTNVQGGFIFTVINHSYTPSFILGDYEEIVTGDAYQDTFSNVFGGITNQVSLALWVEVTNTSPNGASETFEREIVDLIGPSGRQGGAIGNIIEKRSEAELPYVSPVDVFQINVAPQSKTPKNLGEKTIREALSYRDSLTNAYTDGLAAGEDSQMQLAVLDEYLSDILVTQSLNLRGLAEGYLGKIDEANDTIAQSTVVQSYPDKPRLILLSRTAIGDDGTDVRTSFELLNIRERIIANPGQAKSAEYTANTVISLIDKSIELEFLRSLSDNVTSALLIIESATEQGIDLLPISKDQIEVLEHAQFSDEAKARIIDAVAEDGVFVLVPENEVIVDGEATIGWLEFDETGYISAVMETGERAGIASWVSLVAYNVGLFLYGASRFLGVVAGLVVIVTMVMAYVGALRFDGIIDTKGEAVAAAVAAGGIAAGNLCIRGKGFWAEICLGAIAGLAIGTGIVSAWAAIDPPVPNRLLNVGDEPFPETIVNGVLTVPASNNATQIDVNVEASWAWLKGDITTDWLTDSSSPPSNSIATSATLATYPTATNGLGTASITADTRYKSVFEQNLTALVSDGFLLLDNSSGQLISNGDALDATRKLALGNIDSTIQVSAITTSTNQVQLQTTGRFFQLDTTPTTSSVTPMQTAVFDVVIDSNATDTYSLTVEAPTGWEVAMSNTGTFSATAPIGTQTGDYYFAVTAQSFDSPELILTEFAQVIMSESNGVDVVVANDSLITVPMGEIIDTDIYFEGVNGHLANGQMEVVNSAFRINVVNVSTQSHIFDVAISGLPSGWSIISGEGQSNGTQISLDAGETGEIGLYISPPNEFIPTAGTSYTVDVVVTGVDDATLTASDSFLWTMPDQAFPYVTFDELDIYAQPNSIGDITLSVENVGSGSGDFIVTSTIKGEIFFTDIYPTADLTLTPNESNIASLTAGAATTQTILIDTSGAQVGEIYVLEGFTQIDAYRPTAYASLNIVSAETLQLIEAQAALQEVIDSIDTDALANLGDLGDQMTIVTTIFGEIGDAIDDVVTDPTDQDTVDALIDVLTDLLDTLDPSDAADAIQDVIDNLTIHTDPIDIVNDLGDLGDALTDLAEEFAIRTRYPFGVSFTPGVSGNLPGTVTTYTLTIENFGDVDAVYGVTQTTPAGTTFIQYTVPPSTTETILIPVSTPDLGYSTLSAEIIAFNEGEPIPETRIIRRVGFNVVNKFIDVLAVFADPTYVDAGAGSAEISAVIANVANSYRSGIAYTEVISPDGTVVYSSTTPIAIPSGIPATYPIDTVDASLLPQGTYTVAVEIQDETGVLIPDGSNYTILGVGQRVQASHSVSPDLVAPGTVTVTTVITTEIDESGTTTRSEGTVVPSLIRTLPLAKSAENLSPAIPLPLMGIITPTGYTRFESTDAGVTLDGTWSVRTVGHASTGQAHRSNLLGNSAEFTFTGEWASLGFITCGGCGNADIYINGVLTDTVDTYSRYDDNIALYYDLAPGTHTISVSVPATSNPSASNTYVYFDYIDLWDGTPLADGRFEQNDARVLTTNNWANRTSSLASGGSYQRFGSTKWFPFTGDSVTFQGYTYNTTGRLEIEIDGVRQTIVDVQSADSGTRTYSFDGLGSGIHVMRVHAWRGTSLVDAFEAPAVDSATVFPAEAGIVRIEEDDPRVRYNGASIVQMPLTYNNDAFIFASRGYGTNSRTLSDTVSLTFEGSYLGLGLITRANGGIAEIYIDGVSQGTVDTYSKYDSTRSLYYDLGSSGTHTVEVVVLDQRNPLANDDRVHVDYFDVWDGSPMADETVEASLDDPLDADQRIWRTSNWTPRNFGNGSGGGYLRYGSRMWFPFTGDSVGFQSLSFSSLGTVEIFVDGERQGYIDLATPSTMTQTYSFDGFGPGPHVIEVRDYYGNASIDTFFAPGAAPFVDRTPPTGLVRYEEFHPDMRYNGVEYEFTAPTWSGNTYVNASAANARYSFTLSDTVSLTFEGSWISIGTIENTDRGLAEVFIDGVSQGVIDSYSRSLENGTHVYDLGVSGTHTVEIVVLDQRSQYATNDYVVIDYIDVWDGTPMPDGTFDATLESNNDNPRIKRSSNWVNSGSVSAENGNYLRSGSRVWFPFTGDSVSFRSLAYSSAGTIGIRIDGELQGYYDLYSASTISRTFSFDDLGAGPHVIEVRNYRGTAVVDSFTSPGVAPFVNDIPAQTGITRYEDNDPALRYNGVEWEDTATSWTGGTFAHGSRGYGRYSRTISDTVSLTFEGSWVSVGLLEQTNAGIVEILIDGVSQDVVDTYSSFVDTANYVYDLGVGGTHTVTVRVLDQRNPASSDDYLIIDYIDVWDGSTIPDGEFNAVLDDYNFDQRIWRSSNWQRATSATATEGDYLRNGSAVWLPFTGDSVTFQALAFSTAGQVIVRIDGEFKARIDLYNPTTVTRTVSFDGLGAGPHVIEIHNNRGSAIVDGFATPGTAPFYVDPASQTGLVRHEENDVNARFNGVPFSLSSGWTTGPAAYASRGYLRYSSTLSNTFSYTFDGNWVNLGLIERSNGGLAEVFVDGVSQGIVDTYSRYNDTANYVYEPASSGTHTLTVVVLDQRNPYSSNDVIHIDYVDTWDGTAMPDGEFNAVAEPISAEQRIFSSRNWLQTTNASASDGTYLYNGSRIWFPFTGDSVSYQALSYSSAGRVYIRIDGELINTFDLYNPTTITRTFSFEGLGAGPHVIEIVGHRGQAAVDSFTTPGSAPFYVDPAAQPGVVRYEDDDPAMRFNGVPYGETATSWGGSTYSWASRGYARYSRTLSDTFSLTVDGSWINLGLLERTNSGLAEVFIDGVSQGIIDTYSRYNDTVSYAYDLGGNGTHTIAVVVLDQRNPLASDDYIHIDYVDVWDGAPMADGTFEAELGPISSADRVWRSSGFNNYNDVIASNGSYIYNGSRIWFPFTGDSVTFDALAYTSAGRPEVRVDGISVGLLDLYSLQTTTRTFSFDGFGPGAHVIELVARRGQLAVDTYATPGTAPFFDPAPPTGIVRYEENHPALTYNGVPFDETATSWVNDDYSYGSRGYARYSRTLSDTVSLTFDGSWIGLGFVGRTNGGLARIFIDGVDQGIVDTYTTRNEAISFYYELATGGTHTVDIVVLDQRNASSSDDLIRFDFIDVWDGTPMSSGDFQAELEPISSTDRIWRSNNWRNVIDGIADEGNYLYDGSSMWFPFTGTSVNHDAILYNGAGMAELLIDGVSLGIVDLNKTPTEARPFVAADLSDGPHVLQVRQVSGRITVDGFSMPATPVGVDAIDAAFDQAVDIGKPNTIPVELTNYSAYSDTITVTVSSNWPASVNPVLVTLQAGESIVISPTVIVPPTVQVGDTEMLTITTVSQANGNFTTSTLFNLFAVNVQVQLCMALDGSGSVSAAEFELARQGIAAAFRDPTIVPRDGSVEFSFVQFPLSAQVAEVPPTVIVSEASAEYVATLIDNFVRVGGGTPMEQGINACTDLITGSPRFANAPQHVINLPTDGQPNNSAATIAARNAAIAAGITQINAEAVGAGASVNYLRDEIVYPQPGYVAPPYIEGQGGFVIPVTNFQEFAASIREKLRFVFGVYSLDVQHTVPVTGTTILTPTILPLQDSFITDTAKTDIGWAYEQEGNTTETLTLQTVLPDMQAGETRIVAERTVVSYTLSAGEVSQIVLPPLSVAAPHLIAIAPPTQTINAGASAVYSVTLYNLTDAPLPLTLDSIGLPDGWVSGLEDVVVSAESTLTLPITITTPANAALTDYIFSVLVGTPTGGSDQASAQLTLVDGFDINIIPPVQTALVGDSTSYDIVIENPASVAQTYTLSLDGLDAATQASLPATVTVGAGAMATVTLPVDAAFVQGVEPFAVNAVNEGGVMGADNAALEIIGETGVSISIDPASQIGGPGAATLYTVTVSNDGDFIDTFDLIVDLPAGWVYEWQANGQPTTPLTLSPAVFNQAFLYLLITPPAGTTPASYPFSVSTASSINASATASDSAELIVTAQGVDVDIVDILTPVAVGSTVQWTVLVTNSGTVADTFDLSNFGIAGSQGSFSQSSVSLAAGASTTVQLTLATPDFVLPGTPYPLMVSAESQTVAAVSDNDITNIFFTENEGVGVEWLQESQTVESGDGVDYFFTITNTGNIDTEYALSFSTATGVGLTPELNTIEIPARLAAVVKVSADSDLGSSGTFDIVGSATATNTSASDDTLLNVTIDNRAPSAVDDATTIDEDTSALSFDVLDNDSDLDGDVLAVIDITGDVSGTAVLNPDYTVSFTPTVNYNGVVTLTYTISDGNFTDEALYVITVNPINDPPVAVDDDVQVGMFAAAFNIDVLNNDFDVDSDTLAIVTLTVPLTGTASISGTLIVYTPTVNRAPMNVDQFVYTITDGQGEVATATVRVELQDTTSVTLLGQLSQPAPTLVIALLLFLLPLTAYGMRRRWSRRSRYTE